MQNEYRLFCPGKNNFGICGQEWDNVQVLTQSALSPDEYIFFSGKMSFNFLNKMSNDYIKQCPGCNFYCQREKVMDSHLCCIKCSDTLGYKFKFCWHCLNHWTPGHKCFVEYSDNVAEIQKQLKECSIMTLDYSNMCGVPSKRLCPNCKALLQLDQACKTMLCIYCKTEFCFACLQKATKGKLSCGEFDQRCVVAPIQSTD